MGPGHKRIEYNLIKLDEMNGYTGIVNYDVLYSDGTITKCRRKGHKLMPNKIVVGKNPYEPGEGEFIVQAHAFTVTAREAVEERGGVCQLLSRSTGKPIDPNDKTLKYGAKKPPQPRKRSRRRFAFIAKKAADRLRRKMEEKDDTEDDNDDDNDDDDEDAAGDSEQNTR